MADDTVNIEVNGVPMKARKGAMIIHATDVGRTSTCRASATTRS